MNIEPVIDHVRDSQLSAVDDLLRALATKPHVAVRYARTAVKVVVVQPRQCLELRISPHFEMIHTLPSNRATSRGMTSKAPAVAGDLTASSSPEPRKLVSGASSGPGPPRITRPKSIPRFCANAQADDFTLAADSGIGS